MNLRTLAFASLLFGLAISAASADTAPIPESLANSAGAVCLKVAENGQIAGAFVLVSTGSKRKDRDLLLWAKQLRWPVKKKEGEVRSAWFPMALVTGAAREPTMPKSCEPISAQASD